MIYVHVMKSRSSNSFHVLFSMLIFKTMYLPGVGGLFCVLWSYLILYQLSVIFYYKDNLILFPIKSINTLWYTGKLSFLNSQFYYEFSVHFHKFSSLFTRFYQMLCQLPCSTVRLNKPDSGFEHSSSLFIRYWIGNCEIFSYSNTMKNAMHY